MRSLNFICKCLCNSSQLASAIANYGINYSRYISFLGHNAMFCTSKFNVNVCDIGSGVANVRWAVDRYVERKVEERQIQAADFLRELLFIRDDHLVLSTMSVLLVKNLNHLLTIFALIRPFSITSNPA